MAKPAFGFGQLSPCVTRLAGWEGVPGQVALAVMLDGQSRRHNLTPLGEDKAGVHLTRYRGCAPSTNPPHGSISMKFRTFLGPLSIPLNYCWYKSIHSGFISSIGSIVAQTHLRRLWRAA